MHRAFSSIQTPNDVDTAVDLLVQDGFVPNNREITEKLRQEIAEAIQQPDAQAWFDGSRQALTETNILLPDDGEGLHRLRPDRVMISPEKVEVIDYKFGEVEETAHQEQLKRYISCLYEMGYPSVEGYLWYVNKGKIIAISA